MCRIILALRLEETAVKNVPLSRIAIDHFSNQVFPEYRWSYPFEIVVAVPNPSFKVMAHKGGLFRVSPEEPEFAAFLKYAQLIKENGLDQCSHQKLHTMFRFMPFTFKLLPKEEDRLWESIKLREIVAGLYDIVVRSTLQRIFELMNVKLTMERRHVADNIGSEKISATKLATIYAEKVPLAKSSEPVSETFILQAVSVWETLCPFLRCVMLFLHWIAFMERMAHWVRRRNSHTPHTKANDEDSKLWLVGHVAHMVENIFHEKRTV